MGRKGSNDIGERNASGSFAALRMTAGTGDDNYTSKSNDAARLGEVEVEKHISPLRCSQVRERLRSK
jgi:hypothetical protein